jgi:hypothetical protein
MYLRKICCRQRNDLLSPPCRLIAVIPIDSAVSPAADQLAAPDLRHGVHAHEDRPSTVTSKTKFASGASHFFLSRACPCRARSPAAGAEPRHTARRSEVTEGVAAALLLQPVQMPQVPAGDAGEPATLRNGAPLRRRTIKGGICERWLSQTPSIYPGFIRNAANSLFNLCADAAELALTLVVGPRPRAVLEKKYPPEDFFQSPRLSMAEPIP